MIRALMFNESPNDFINAYIYILIYKYSHKDNIHIYFLRFKVTHKIIFVYF